eukprot:gene14302-29_t
MLDEEGLRGAWFGGRIAALQHGYALVEYCSLYEDEEGTAPLKEWFLLPPPGPAADFAAVEAAAAATGGHQVHGPNKQHFLRPVPPQEGHVRHLTVWEADVGVWDLGVLVEPPQPAAAIPAAAAAGGAGHADVALHGAAGGGGVTGDVGAGRAGNEQEHRAAAANKSLVEKQKGASSSRKSSGSGRRVKRAAAAAEGTEDGCGGSGAGSDADRPVVGLTAARTGGGSRGRGHSSAGARRKRAASDGDSSGSDWEGAGDEPSTMSEDDGVSTEDQAESDLELDGELAEGTGLEQSGRLGRAVASRGAGGLVEQVGTVAGRRRRAKQQRQQEDQEGTAEGDAGVGDGSGTGDQEPQWETEDDEGDPEAPYMATGADVLLHGSVAAGASLRLKLTTGIAARSNYKVYQAGRQPCRFNRQWVRPVVSSSLSAARRAVAPVAGLAGSGSRMMVAVVRDWHITQAPVDGAVLAMAAGDLGISAPAGGVKVCASAWEKVVHGAVQAGVVDGGAAAVMSGGRWCCTDVGGGHQIASTPDLHLPDEASTDQWFEPAAGLPRLSWDLLWKMDTLHWLKQQLPATWGGRSSSNAGQQEVADLDGVTGAAYSAAMQGDAAATLGEALAFPDSRAAIMHKMAFKQRREVELQHAVLADLLPMLLNSCNIRTPDLSGGQLLRPAAMVYARYGCAAPLAAQGTMPARCAGSTTAVKAVVDGSPVLAVGMSLSDVLLQ